MGGQVSGPGASVVDATVAAIEAAGLDPRDLGAAQVLVRVAQAVDDIDEDGLNPAGKLDNVSVPTYLKYAESLGLTPAGRARIEAALAKVGPKAVADESSPARGGALGKLRAVQGGQAG